MANLEEYKRLQKLQEQARSGQVDPEIQKELLKGMNAHIPVFVGKQPWYMKDHTSKEKPKESDLDQWYKRGQTVGKATKYRKGACENCGAMSHKTKECVERPRKKGARWTGKDIQADEALVDVKLSFDAKRDRWNGYDAEQQLELVKEWELVEEKRKQHREQKAKEKLEERAKLAAQGIEVDSDSSDDEKYAESAEQVGQSLDLKQQTTVRNLRIREDTAKYLRNIKDDSVFYDPKSRSMRDNPLADKGDDEFVADSTLSQTGDAINLQKVEQFAWDIGSMGPNAGLQTNPTIAEKMYREAIEQKKSEKQKIKDTILAKYGGQEHLEAPPVELLMAQTEHYVEYAQDGSVIKGNEKPKPKSKYPEDVYHMNHTSVWGSYWKDGKWGYQCCHALVKNAYCQTVTASEPAVESEPTTQPEPEQPEKSLVLMHLEKIKDKKTDNVLDQEKLQKAIEREKKRIRNPDEKDDLLSKEDIEAYHLTKRHHEDPMADYVDHEDRL
ncbi:pre-mRNA-splicing factor SLU7 [Gorgonomyces haynaldii]|nr:pre-mRNA-splicing factor SLU7 [Gorgonomyces haynaldii]